MEFFHTYPFNVLINNLSIDFRIRLIEREKNLLYRSDVIEPIMFITRRIFIHADDSAIKSKAL